MGGTSCASTNPVHVLVAFGGVLCKIDPGAEHAADVGVALVKALMNDGVDEGTSVEEHPFVWTSAGVAARVFFSNFLLAVVVSLP